MNEPLTEKPDPYYIFNILLYMNKLDLFFTFFDGFGVSGIPRITTASEASQEVVKFLLHAPDNPPPPDNPLGPE